MHCARQLLLAISAALEEHFDVLLGHRNIRGDSYAYVDASSAGKTMTLVYGWHNE